MDASIRTRLTREYGLRHPVVSAGMGFIAHERLAAAVSNAGGLGVLGASPDPPERSWWMQVPRGSVRLHALLDQIRRRWPDVLSRDGRRPPRRVAPIAPAAEIITEMMADAQAELDRHRSPTVAG